APWRLSLLFLVSGMAIAFLLARAPRRPGGAIVPQGFIGTRSRRLLLPLAFGMAVVVVPQSYYEVVEQLPGGYHEGYPAFWARYLQADGSFCDAGGCLALPTWNHLWFVAYLWAYTVALWLGLAPGGRAAGARRERAGPVPVRLGPAAVAGGGAGRAPAAAASTVRLHPCPGG